MRNIACARNCLKMADVVGSSPQIAEARLKMLQKLGEASRTGGKGTARRKKKTVHKSTVTDDKKLQAGLKRLGVHQIPGIEEANIFMGDGTVQHFKAPKGIVNVCLFIFSASGR